MILAQCNGGPVLGAAVVGGADLDGVPAGLITHLVTDPVHQGEGIGFMTLRMVGQYLISEGHTPKFLYGACDPKASRFYAKAGFNVTDPGTSLRIPGTTMTMKSNHPPYTAWFYTATVR